jgi:hypothetical protein
MDTKTETTVDPKQAAAAVRALVELCEQQGMRDNPIVIAARATLPKEPPAEPEVKS